MLERRIHITFVEPVLGSAPLNPKIYEEFIASKMPVNDEILQEELGTLGTLDDAMEKGMTGFHVTEEGIPFIYDYVLRGFFKAACGTLRRVSGTRSASLKAYLRIIDGLVFVKPRRLLLIPSGEMYVLQRPLRAKTMQGDRVALASSQAFPEGTNLIANVICLDDNVVGLDILKEWLDYGQWSGLGQWRNGSYGRFTYTLE